MAERGERTLKVVLLVVFLGGTLLMGYAGFVSLFVTAASAQARVTGLVRVSCDGGGYCSEHANVTFFTDSGQRTTTEVELPDGVSIGDHLTVYYDADNPTNAIDGSSRWFPYFLLLGALAMLVALVGIARAEVRKARQKNLQVPRRAYWDGEKWIW